MKRIIKRVAILGSGIMGSRIACHFANIGVEVLLLDIVPPDAEAISNSETATAKQSASRNSIVNKALSMAIKSKPSPLYKASFVQKISTGNFEDDLKKVAQVDWIIEVVIENLAIKKSLFEQVEKYRKPGTLISSNTSGIPIAQLVEGRSEDFASHFTGTHFFNPPRYLKLLEVIPHTTTKKEVVSFLQDFGQKQLGKIVVLCNDTPAFIANRIGVMGILDIAHLVDKMELSVEEIDKFTGPVIGHPKSATFRTSDLVGLDTLIHVADGLKVNVPHDEAKDLFEVPPFMRLMMENKTLGDKTGAGFYKKVKNENGKSEILALDLKSLTYRPAQKVKSSTLELTKTVSSVKARLPMLVKGQDKSSAFYRASFASLFAYSSNRIPEIASHLFQIDDAMEAGFGWELGPFKQWDAIGLKEGLALMDAEGKKAAPWVYEMVAAGYQQFYKVEQGLLSYYDITSQKYAAIPGKEECLQLDVLRDEHTLYSNAGLSIIDLGDGILNVEFHSKMNTIGGDALTGLNKAIDMAEKDYKGIVISNSGANFSAGANVGMIFMMAVEQDYDELNATVNLFQQTTMRLRYSAIPVVAAPHQLTLGGGCEICLHADKVIAHAETYMGLVEFGVGLIPGGGGTKEFALRLSDAHRDGDIDLNVFREKFLTIGQAKVSSSAHEAFELGYLRPWIDEVVVSRERQLSVAKAACLKMANDGYQQPQKRKDVRVLGNQALGIVHVGASSMYLGNYMSEHDLKISEKLGYVLAGGDLSAPSLVSEQYLLDLERKAFLSLSAEKKTLERIQSIINGGKVLRN